MCLCRFTTALGIVALIAASASAGGTIHPWSGADPVLSGARPVGPPSTNRAVVGLQDGADHIIGQQCTNGGFGWPHNSCSATFNNITGPICLGLLDAYQYTNDAAHLAAAVSGGDYDLTFQYTNGEARFGAFAPYFLWRLSQASGDPQYSNHAATKFFDELTAGTYGPDDLDTAGWILSVQTGRTGTWVNLRPWEFSNIIPAAAAIGNTGQVALFVQGILDGLNTLDNTAPGSVYSDLIGLAGAVRGLAYSGTTSFPPINSPNHAGINGISTLEGLANALVGYQNPDGSWYWHSNLATPTTGDEDTQTTAYAVLALVAADPLVAPNYSGEMQAARNWINSMQLLSGGFLSYPGGDENTEVEGEALSAVAVSEAAIPAVSEWGLVVLTLIGLVCGSIVFGRWRMATR